MSFSTTDSKNHTPWAKLVRRSVRQQRAAIEAGKPDLAAIIAKATVRLLDRHLAAMPQ